MSEIKAGKYELTVLLWDRPTSKLGEPYDYVRHVQGDVVDLNAEEARRLVSAGAAVEPGSRERATAAALRAQYEQVLAQLPDPITTQDGVAESDVPNGDPGDGIPVPTEEKPAQAAPKAHWVAYAESLGMDSADAEGMSKQDLIAALS